MAQVEAGEDPFAEDDEKKKTKKRKENPEGLPAGEAGSNSTDADEVNMSLAAMEAQLLPGVLEGVDKIAALYALEKAQQKRLESIKAGGSQSALGEELREAEVEMVDLMRAIRLNTIGSRRWSTRYGLNRDDRPRRPAAAHLPKAGVTREDFLKHYYGQRNPGFQKPAARRQGLEELPRPPQRRSQDHPQRHLAGGGPRASAGRISDASST
jgi:RNA polymerase primary sigma factor